MPSGLPRHGHPAAHPAVGPFVFDAFATSTGSRFHSFDSWHRWELEMRNPKCRHAPSNDQSFSMMATLPRLSMKPWLGFCPFLELCWSLPMSSLLITQNFLTSQYCIYNINIPSKLRKHLSIPRPPNRMIGENMVAAQMTCPSRICWRFCRHSRCCILSHRIKSSPSENCVSGGAKERITKSQSCSNKGYVSWVHFHQFHQVCHAGPPKLLHLREILGKNQGC